MKQLSRLPMLLVVLVFFAFVSDTRVHLINKTNKVFDEQLFNRLLLQKLKLKVKEQPVDVTVLSFSSTTIPVHLKNANADSERRTLRVEYQCDLIVKVGKEIQRIQKDEFWEGPMGSIAVAPPTDEQLIVNTIDKHFRFKF